MNKAAGVQLSAIDLMKSPHAVGIGIMGASSFGLDFTEPENNSGWILGWILLVSVIVVPSSLARLIKFAPLPKSLAVIWCFASLLLYFAGAGVLPINNGLHFIVAIIMAVWLCWRLLYVKSDPD